MFDGNTPIKKLRQWIAGTAFGPTGYDGKQNLSAMSPHITTSRAMTK
jgi:hypothetical protein